MGPDGKFTAEAPDYQGRWVKEADRDIIRKLRAEGLLFHQEQYLHDYPFCWRAEEDPLIQYPRKSWFIRTTQFQGPDAGQQPPRSTGCRSTSATAASAISWRPTSIGPCPASAIGARRCRSGSAKRPATWRPWPATTNCWPSRASRAPKSGSRPSGPNPELSEHLKVHKPYIDAVTYDSPKAPGKRMRRVSEVIDCWFDSGAMPFAQWGYPHQPGSAERFAGQFPADFISEALDQTRGWFYSLLAISTLLFSEDERATRAAGRPVQGRPVRRARPPARPCPIRTPSATASCWG